MLKDGLHCPVMMICYGDGDNSEIMDKLLILVRHSISRQDPTVSAHQWTLTEEGLARCELLARHLQAHQPSVIVSSEEPKAVQTAQAVADRLRLPHHTEHDLHEHRRTSAPYGTQAEFEARIRRLLEHPDQLVFGDETGGAACDRFQAAIEKLLAHHPQQTLAAVTHGTVMTLFLARVAGVDAFSFWQKLGMPAYVVLSLPDYALLKIVAVVKD